MCTYVTENVALSGSAKGVDGWFRVSRATVYFDHPVHAPLDHSLNIDFADVTAPTRRVAVELGADSARALAHAILATLEAAADLQKDAS
ncbi:MAG TPA: DUF6295 family protein [Acidimicrobiales bacterium]|jgi:hypothetical protein|nr:DUF6295 family protein [Acidimicrobiales bacterium]